MTIQNHSRIDTILSVLLKTIHRATLAVIQLIRDYILSKRERLEKHIIINQTLRNETMRVDNLTVNRANSCIPLIE